MFDADEHTEFAMDRGFQVAIEVLTRLLPQGYFPNMILFEDGEPSRVFRGSWATPKAINKFIDSSTRPASVIPTSSSQQQVAVPVQSNAVMELAPGRYACCCILCE